MPLMFSKPALRWFYITLGIVGVIYVVYLSQATLILLGISFVVAYLFDPSIDRPGDYPADCCWPGEHGRTLSGRYPPVTAPGASCGWTCPTLGPVAL